MQAGGYAGGRSDSRLDAAARPPESNELVSALSPAQCNDLVDQIFAAFHGAAELAVDR